MGKWSVGRYISIYGTEKDACMRNVFKDTINTGKDTCMHIYIDTINTKEGAIYTEKDTYILT